jgi:hypothetical protein
VSRRHEPGEAPIRRFLALLAIAAVASVLYVTTAPGAQQAGPPRGKQIAALQKQVRAIQKQLQALKERTTLLRSQVVWTVGMLENVIRDGETCFAALTADELQNTWSQVDRLAISLGAPPIFGTQTAVGDKNACQGLSVPRPPLNPSVAPTVAPLTAFILWLHGG